MESHPVLAHRGAMNIDGIGESLTQALVNAGLVHDPADLFALTMAQLVPPERPGGCAPAGTHGEEVRGKPAESLETARTDHPGPPDPGLGIPNVGTVAAKSIARVFKTFEALVDASPEDRQNTIAQIDGVGPVIAEAVAAFFAEPANQRLFQKLLTVGVNPAEPEEQVKTGPLQVSVLWSRASCRPPAVKFKNALKPLVAPLPARSAKTTTWWLAPMWGKPNSRPPRNTAPRSLPRRT